MRSAVAAGMPPLLLVAMLAGCAATRLEKIEAGQEVAIVSADRGSEGATIEISNKVIGKDAGTGAVGGMVAFAPLGLSCGPWAPLCVPFTAMVGAGVGALGGAVVGVAESLSSETKQQLRGRLDAYREANDPRQRVVEAIADQAKAHWTITPAGSAMTVVVKLEEVSLHALREDRIALVVKAAVGIRRPGENAKTEPDTKTFDYVGPESDVRQWIEDRNDFVARSFDHAFGHIARRVVADLAR